MEKEKVIVESRMPKVGIFWFYKDQIIDFSEEISNLTSTGGFIDSPFDHVSVWDKVVRLYPELKEKEYYEIPRGRVLYNEENKIFSIVTSEELANNKIKMAKVMRVFSLPLKTKLVSDLHYELEPSLDMWED